MCNVMHEGAGRSACCLGAILGSTHVLDIMKVADPEYLGLSTRLDSERHS